MFDLVLATVPDPGPWRLLGRLHPLVVHFPIALILFAAAIELLMAFRPRHRISPTALRCIAVGAVSAVVAAWFGWLNADHETHGAAVATTIAFHRWIGIAAAATACTAVLLSMIQRVAHRDWALAGYRGALLLSAACVGVGGHLGGVLVYGQGYLAAVLPWRDAPATATATTPTPVAVPGSVTPPEAAAASNALFATSVRPIILERCASCHGERRQRGQLRLEPITAALEQSPEWAVIIPGDAEASPLVERLRLPADDPERMPADGAPLGAAEIDAFVRWIDAGCPIESTETEPAVSTAPPDEPDPVPSIDEEPVVRPDPAAAASSLAARRAAMTAIVLRGGTAVPIAAGRNELDVNLSLAAPAVTDDDLALLDGLEPYLAQLNLARSGITDAGLARVGEFTNLRRLRLDRCAIGDDGLAELGALQHLTHLNLYGTRIGDEGVRTLAQLGALRSVSLWRTEVTEEGAEWLRRERPEMEVLRGVEVRE